MLIVFDQKTLIFLIIVIFIMIATLIYFLRECNCKIGPKGDQGERGDKGEKGDKGDKMDLSNYKGNIKVIGDITSSGTITSGDCPLTCQSTGLGAGWMILIIVTFIGLLCLGLYIYNKE
jgi:hypothetical protein